MGSFPAEPNWCRERKEENGYAGTAASDGSCCWSAGVGQCCHQQGEFRKICVVKIQPK